MASISNFGKTPVGQEGVFPIIRSLNTTASFSEITEPGFLNSAMGAGINFSPGDMFLVQYPGGTQFFYTIESQGIYTLQIYDPGSNSFAYDGMFFVSKSQGASDANPGNQMGFPKLTIQNALNAANSSSFSNPCVYVLDAETYFESLLITPLKNITLYMPYANLESGSSNALNLGDSGQNYVFNWRFNQVNMDGTGANFLSLNGPNSNIFCNGNIVAGGNAYIDGGCVLSVVALVQCNVVITANGVFGPSIKNAIAVSITNAGTGNIYGSIGQIPGSVSNYGDVSFLGNTQFQFKVLPEDTVGRAIVPEDNCAIVSYNSISEGSYILESNFPIGGTVQFLQIASGRIVFVAGAGVTIASRRGNLVRTLGSFSKAEAQKISDTVWVISGDIQAIP